MIRVGFIISSWGDGWMGGKNYISNLFHAVYSLSDRQIELVLIVPHDFPQSGLEDFPALEIVRDNRAASSSILYKSGKALGRFFGRNLVMEALAREYKIDVFSHSERTGRHSPVPTLSWIPDFQHLRRPEFFSSEEVTQRTAMYRRQIENSKVVILSSEDAARDLAKFAPKFKSKSRVMHFSTRTMGGSNFKSLSNLELLYDFKAPYFHVPNQYWVHKNHVVVIEALKLIKDSGGEACIISTGQTEDYRNPGHFAALTTLIRDYGLEQNYRILGLVPYEDLTALMHHSLAIINPSLFEGWSTTVEESKSSGKAILLSDIPVHREQNPKLGLFFDPASPEELASAMSLVMRDQPMLSDADRADCLSESVRRYEAFGRTFEKIVLEVTG